MTAANSSAGDSLIWYLDDELDEFEIEKKMLREGGHEMVLTRSGAYSEDYGKYAHRARGIIITPSFPLLGKEDVKGLTRCKIISVNGGGYNNVDIETATKQGIAATFVPGYCVEEVSDHAIALMLGLNRCLPQCQEMTRKGVWKAVQVGPIHRIKGQVLGLLGFGRIARTVARKAKCFGLHVKAYDPYVSESEMNQLDVKKVEFAELVSTADFFSLHVLLTEETYHLFDAKVFDAMKNTAYLINTCRGDVVDEAALISALKDKKIAGAGLDVLSKEPPEALNPLLHMPNVIVSPHSAFMSHEAEEEVRFRSTKAVIDALEDRIPEDIINPEIFKKGK